MSSRFDRLLAGNGVPEMARILDRYGNNFDAINEFRRRHKGITSAEAGRFVSLGAASRRAGRAQAALPPDDRGHLAGIPVNRGLFGDQPAGRRLQYNVQINVIERETGRVIKSFAHIVESATLMSAKQLIPDLTEANKKDLRYYTELREQISPGMEIEFEQEILGIQRRY